MVRVRVGVRVRVRVRVGARVRVRVRVEVRARVRVRVGATVRVGHHQPRPPSEQCARGSLPLATAGEECHVELRAAPVQQTRRGTHV